MRAVGPPPRNVRMRIFRCGAAGRAWGRVGMGRGRGRGRTRLWPPRPPWLRRRRRRALESDDVGGVADDRAPCTTRHRATCHAPGATAVVCLPACRDHPGPTGGRGGRLDRPPNAGRPRWRPQALPPAPLRHLTASHPHSPPPTPAPDWDAGASPAQSRIPLLPWRPGQTTEPLRTPHHCGASTRSAPRQGPAGPGRRRCRRQRPPLPPRSRRRH